MLHCNVCNLLDYPTRNSAIAPNSNVLKFFIEGHFFITLLKLIHFEFLAAYNSFIWPGITDWGQWHINGAVVYSLPCATKSLDTHDDCQRSFDWLKLTKWWLDQKTRSKLSILLIVRQESLAYLWGCMQLCYVSLDSYHCRWIVNTYSEMISAHCTTVPAGSSLRFIVAQFEFFPTC